MSADEKRPPINEQLKDLNKQFQEHTDLGEMAMYGRLGFHTFYDNDSPELTRGPSTILHIAFEKTIEELWLDEDIIQENQWDHLDDDGEVTPEAVAREVKSQLDEFIGRRFNELFAQNVQDILERRAESVGGGR